MKKLLLLVFFISANVFSQEVNKLFVGYINDVPVFDAYKEDKLYTLKDKPEFLQDYPKKYSAIAVKDDCFVYQDDSRLMVSYKGVETVYDGFTCFAAIGTEGTVYAMNQHDSIKILKEGKVTDTGLKGWPVLVQDGFLYYNDIHDLEIIHPNADLYKTDLKTLKNPERIMVNSLGDLSTVIYPGGKYVYDLILYGGTFRPVLYSVDNGKYYEIHLTEEFTRCIPFYSYQDKCLVFYNIQTLKTFKLPLPDAFTFERPIEE